MLKVNIVKNACRFTIDQSDMFWSWGVLGLKNIALIIGIVFGWLICAVGCIALASFVIKPVAELDGWFQLIVGAIVIAVFCVISFFVSKFIIQLSNVWALNALDGAHQRPWRQFDTSAVRASLPLLWLAQGLIVAVGLICLIIPGIIFAVRFSLARYVMLDQQCGVGQALSTSWKMTKREEWHLLLLLLMMYLYRLIPLTLLFDSIFPISNLMYASIYVQIKEQQDLEKLTY